MPARGGDSRRISRQHTHRGPSLDIDPNLFDRLQHGESVVSTLAALGCSPDVNDRDVREAIEEAVTDLIAHEDDEARSGAA
jgi:hypothetical protein